MTQGTACQKAAALSSVDRRLRRIFTFLVNITVQEADDFLDSLE
jgi:hypothetical protein